MPLSADKLVIKVDVIFSTMLEILNLFILKKIVKN